MVLPENLSGPQTDADNRAWHEEIDAALPGLALPNVQSGSAGHLSHHATINTHVNTQTGSTLPTNPQENDPDHELHHNTIHAYINGLQSGATNISLTADDTDQTASLMSQINAAPDGTLGNPTVLLLPTGNYRIDGAIHLTNRNYVELTGPVGGGFMAYTDLSSNEIGIISSGRIHFAIFTSTGCSLKWIHIFGPNNERSDVVGREEFAYYKHFPDDPEGKVYVFDHAFSIQQQSTDCSIEDCQYNDIYGDGVYIGGPLNGNANTNITVKRVTGTHAGRQSIALTCVEGFTAEDLDLDFGGRSGLDIEPNHADDRVYNATLTRCRIGAIFNAFVVNGAMPAGAILPRMQDISLIDCEQIRCPTTRAPFSNTKGTSGGTLTIRGMTGPNNQSRTAIGIQGPWNDVVIEDCDIPNGQSAQSTLVTTAVLGTGITGSLIIRNNTLNGVFQGFDNLYDVGTNTPSITQCGNVWDMGAQNDGVCP